VKENDEFVKIVEESDATEEEKSIKEINTGVYLLNLLLLKKLLVKFQIATPKANII